MTKVTYILLVTASLNICAHGIAAASFSFNYSDFGKFPAIEMRCIKGGCLQPDKNKHIIDSFIKPSDEKTFCGLKISSPQYDFYKNKLFRIIFRFEDIDEEHNAIFSSITHKLKQHYGMRMVSDTERQIDSYRSSHVVVLASEHGVVAKIVSYKYGSCWITPYVKLQKTELINTLNKAMNPKYIPKNY